MGIVENARRHFRARLAGEKQSIEVPEWGTDDEPARLYIRPTTLKQRGELLGVLAGGDKAEFAAKMIQVFASDSEGKSLFAKGEIKELMEVDSEVAFRVAQQIEDIYARNNKTDVGES